MANVQSYDVTGIVEISVNDIEAVGGGLPFLIGLAFAAGTGGGLAALVLAAEDALGIHNHYS